MADLDDEITESVNQSEAETNKEAEKSDSEKSAATEVATDAETAPEASALEAAELETESTETADESAGESNHGNSADHAVTENESADVEELKASEPEVIEASKPEVVKAAVSASASSASSSASSASGTASKPAANATPPASSGGGGGGSTLSKKWLAEKWLSENQSDAAPSVSKKSEESGTHKIAAKTNLAESSASIPKILPNSGSTLSAADKAISIRQGPSTLSKRPGDSKNSIPVAKDSVAKDAAAKDSAAKDAAAKESVRDADAQEAAARDAAAIIEAAAAKESLKFGRDLSGGLGDELGDSSVSIPAAKTTESIGTFSSADLNAIGTSSSTSTNTMPKSSAAKPPVVRQSDSTTALSRLSSSSASPKGKKGASEPERSEEEDAQARELSAMGRKKMKESSFAATGISADNPHRDTGKKRESKEVIMRRAMHTSGAWISLGVLIAAGVVAYNQFQTSKSSKHLSNVEFALKTGNQKEALDELNSAIAADPEHHPEAYVSRGTIYLSMKRGQDAASDFRSALQMEPNNVKAMCGQGQAWLMLGNAGQAEADFKKAIKSAPKDPQPYRLRAKMYQASHQTQKANADFAKVLFLAGSDATPDDYAAVGQAQYDAGQYSAAAKNFDSALKKGNRQSDLIRLGECYNKLNESDKALAAFRHAIVLDPTVASTYFEIGKLELSKKNYDDAVNSLNDALAKSPNMKEALLARANAYLGLKEYNHAVSDFDGYLKLDPKAAAVKKQREIAYARVIAMPKAIATGSAEPKAGPALPPADLKKFAEQVKTDEPGVVQAARSYLSNGNAEAAVTLLVMCIKSNPADLNARRLLALAFYSAGRYDSAATQYQELSAVAALSDDEQRNYLRALTSSNHASEAIHVIMKMMAAKPNDDDLQILLVQTYANAGMQDKAQMAAHSALAKVSSQVARDKINEILNNGGGGNAGAVGGGTTDAPPSPGQPVIIQDKQSQDPHGKS